MPRTCGQQVAPTVLSETLFALPTTLSRMTPQRDLAAGTARHPFLSRKGCKSDPRGAPLGYPPDGARCFPGSMGGDFSPNPGGQHHWIPPGCSEKSSAAAETARAPAENKTRPEFYLRHCPRHPRFCLERYQSAIWQRALPAAGRWWKKLIEKTSWKLGRERLQFSTDMVQ